MFNTNNCVTGKFTSDKGLHKLISFSIHAAIDQLMNDNNAVEWQGKLPANSFVKNQYLSFAQHGSGKDEELSLAM